MADNFKPCPECGGKRIDAEIATHTSGNVVLKQKYRLFTKTSRLTALICTNCGYTSLYADKPQNLIDKRPDKPIDQ